MQLIASVASGIVGAANGTAALYRRGTASLADYYLDFEATQPVSGSSSIALDTNGAAVLYVNELVDVIVKDAGGTQVREFVAGETSSAIEVISRSFTGTDYGDGSSGASKPTTLQAVLDRWYGSAGALDFKVQANGSAISLTAAVAGLAGLFFNVKSYSAVGDGVADDTAAMQAAADAATAAGGGTVFFPPGTYRITTTFTVRAGVNLLGPSSLGSKIHIDNAGTIPTAIQFDDTDSGARTVQGLWFDAQTQNFAPPLLLVAGVGSSVDFQGCIFGGSTLAGGYLLKLGAGRTAFTRTSVRNCTFYATANNVPALFASSGGSDLLFLDTCYITVRATAYTASVIAAYDGVTILNCTFDADAVTSGAVKYISYHPATAWGSNVFIGNRFSANPSGVQTIAFYNSAVTPLYDCYEVGNAFGDQQNGWSNIIPYGYATANYAGTANIYAPNGHYSRASRVAFVTSDATPLTVDAGGFGTIFLIRTNGTNQTLDFGAGRQGDKFTLIVQNQNAGNAPETWGAHVLPDNAIAPTHTIGAALQTCYLYEWQYNVTKGGAWVQTAAFSSATF